LRGIAGCSGEIADNPKEGDNCFASVENFVVGTNKVALQAAEVEGMPPFS